MPKPNLLLILTDHWRGDCLGRLGHPVAETPHLDSLSRRGITFTRAYTPCASCIAARRSIMTGQTPATHGMVGYKDGIPWQHPVNLAGELTRAGYQTANIGKTHFHPKRLHLGFEQLTIPDDFRAWLATQPGAAAEYWTHGVPGNSWIGRPHQLAEDLMEETYLVGRSLDFLERRDPTRPFFLCLSFNGPHPPWCPPRVYYDQFIDREIPGPVTGAWAERHARDGDYPLDVNTWRGRLPEHLNQRARAAYFAFLAFIDAQIGRLLDRMQRGGLLRDTLVAFSCDHGEMLGDHNLWRKTYAYEGSSRIPFIVVPPAGAPGPRNQESPALVGLEDIMPTFLETAGAPVPEGVEGRSLLPLLEGRETEWREYYHGEHSPCYHPENANHFVTDGTWKYIWNPINGEEQLFNLQDDPDECSDLAANPVYEEMRVEWSRVMARELAGRPEGFSDGERLTTAPYPVWHGTDPGEVHRG